MQAAVLQDALLHLCARPLIIPRPDGLFDKAKGRIVGSDQYLTKPFSKEELLGAIKAHVPDFAPVEQAS